MANEMRDRHLVKDNPQNMTESMLNFAYAKNERVYLSYANGTEDIDLCEYISQLTKGGCELSADDVMQGSCIEGCDCEKAVIYALAVQAAELRERLKHYESLEERGLLQTFPCNVGDTVYVISDCSRIMMHYDNDYFTGTGAITCPYEDACEFTECNDGNTQVIETCVSHLLNDEYDDWTFDCENINCCYSFNEIGKTVFLTKSEAEQKLKEMRKEDEGK